MDRNKSQNRNRNRNDRERREPEFLEQVIALDRVVRVVKGGRRFRFRALVVIGDGKRKVGVGVSKSGDVQGAIGKAVADAKKNMFEISIDESTVPHEVIGRHSASRVMLKPAAEGTGLIAGGTVRSILDVTGLKNLLSKSLGSSTKINVAYATVDALKQLQPKESWVNQPPAKKKSAKSANSKPAADKPAVETDEKPADKKAPAKKPATKKAPAKVKAEA